MSILHFLIKTGHSLDYALNLSIIEKMVILGIIQADNEIEYRKWGGE